MERIAALLQRDEPVTWVFTGDSVVNGGVHTHGHRDQVELFAERVRVELARRRDPVINTAVGGRTITDVLDDVEHGVHRYCPDVVVIGVGLNDSRHRSEGVASFVKQYEELCTQILNRGGIPVVQTPNGFTPTAASFVIEHLAGYTAAIRELAGRLAVPLVDQAAVWSEAAERGVLEQWINQDCHPNQYGHRAMAHTLFRAFGIHDRESSPTCRLPFP